MKKLSLTQPTHTFFFPLISPTNMAQDPTKIYLDKSRVISYIKIVGLRWVDKYGQQYKISDIGLAEMDDDCYHPPVVHNGGKLHAPASPEDTCSPTAPLTPVSGIGVVGYMKKTPPAEGAQHKEK